MPARTIGYPRRRSTSIENRVKIVARSHTVEHPRHAQVGRTSYLPDQRAELLAHVAGERGRLYFKRQQVLDLGRDAEDS